jgi:antitoxin component of MazEF toxin-antitoxin module
MTIHWSNAFSFRRRLEVQADAVGKMQVILPKDILDVIGLKVGDELIVVVDASGRLSAGKSAN